MVADGAVLGGWCGSGERMCIYSGPLYALKLGDVSPVRGLGLGPARLNRPSSPAPTRAPRHLATHLFPPNYVWGLFHAAIVGCPAS